MDYTSFDSGSAHTIGSDKLRKAIERNRAKQEKRQSRLSNVTRPQFTSTASARRTVAKPDTVEFSPAVRSSSKALTKLNYRATKTPTTTRKAQASVLSPKWQRYLTRTSWVICAALMVRLLFSDGGVIDFYKRQAQLDKRHAEYQDIINQNKKLLFEIKKIKSDSSYQKKLVRDHLGLISADEYLVVFP